MRRANYAIVGAGGPIIVLKDLNGPVSITNDAEAVVAEVVAQHGDRRIQYIDSMGNLDELVHENGRFTGFKPAQTQGRNT